MGYEEGFGFGIAGRIKRTLEGRATSVKQTIKDTKDVVKAQKPFVPGAILSNQINNMRKANQELAPGVKELTT